MMNIIEEDYKDNRSAGSLEDGNVIAEHLISCFN